MVHLQACKLRNDNMNVGVCSRRRGHTFVVAAFAAAPVRLGEARGCGGRGAAPTRLLMNHFVATAASAHINTASMRCILF